MSLLGRVTSVEQLSPERGRSPVGERGSRKLSFSPLPGDWEPPVHHEHAQPIGAFEVPRSKRISVYFTLSFNSRR
jgi:hypothetical protein